MLDFGIAKALSLSRKVTRNDFGSIAYLSPERLESGESGRSSRLLGGRRDALRDASRRAAVRAPDTPAARAADRGAAAAGAARPRLPGGSEGHRREAAGAHAAARYLSAAAIREDLERAAAGQQTMAQAEGWPDSASRFAPDEATRRTRALAEPDEVTRVVTRVVPRVVKTAAPHVTPPPLPVHVPPPPPLPARRVPVRAWARMAMAAAVLGALLGISGLTANEVRVYRRASGLVPGVRTSDLSDLPGSGAGYNTLSQTSFLRVGVKRLAHELTAQTQTLADRVIRNYSTGVSGIREAQWKQARAPLVFASRVDPDDRRIQATLRFIEGHLHRIDGDGHMDQQPALAQRRARRSADRVSRSSGAAAPVAGAVPGPRPHLHCQPGGPGKGEDAIVQAQRLGQVSIEPETRLLAAGYRKRGDTFAANAVKLTGGRTKSHS